MGKIISLFVKGFIIGICKVVPGVSGSMIAISMGLYEKGVHSLCTFYKKDSFLFLLNSGMGILFAIIFGSNVILYCLENYGFYTFSFFIGLIFCSLLQIKRKVILFDKRIGISIIICFTIMIFSYYSPENSFHFTPQISTFLFLVFVGFMEAFTMIVPGISGTAVMMMLGVYSFMMKLWSELWMTSHFLYYFSVFFPYLIGLVIGTFLITKGIRIAFHYHEKITYYCIFGFSLSAFYFLIQCLLEQFTNNVQGFLGILFFILGLSLSYRFDS